MSYQIVTENPESTVVIDSDQLTPIQRSGEYQSESALEKALIQHLTDQNYEYLDIHSEDDLIANLREQLGKLNRLRFTDSEWSNFFRSVLANSNSGIVEKTALLQEGDSRQLLTRDNGTKKNILLIDKENIHKNSLQVINQYVAEEGTRENRYDVTLLVNGFPMVHIELKRRGVELQEAFNQIDRYERESFWSGAGLFEYVQIFVISNGTYTKYYSNSTRNDHLKEQGEGRNKKGKGTRHSFEFTSWWADANNKPIFDLMDFARTFLTRHSLLSILTRYCVFTSEKKLLVMRPYQIVATERIINRIVVAHNTRKEGTIDAGGYVWHTTGSGKTLTSFKTAQLAQKLDFIDKVLFVVDRKDLDYQTCKEYDRFEKGAANGSQSTAILERQIKSPDQKILITTIQKLERFVRKNQKNRDSLVLSKNIVLIFDECHRSQYGEMHKAITRFFKNYYLFGFTGTPIFAANASGGKFADLRTTEQAFGRKLHTYTIVDAIRDKNVLPFRVDYLQTAKQNDPILDCKVTDIDREKILNAPERIQKIVKCILDDFDLKTKRNVS